MFVNSSSGRVRSTWVADFETTTDIDDCRVWGWGIVDIDDRRSVTVGTDIASFINVAADSNKVIYFHNLKFDGLFIIDYLFRQGYKHTQREFKRRGEFSTLISKQGMFYSIKVHWFNGRECEFRDSMKKLPMSVAAIAKSFDLKETKGEIDYTAERPVGWEITDDEREYIETDVKIVAEALAVQMEEGMRKLTVGSDSLAEFKRLMGAKQFQRLFPVLPNTIDEEIRAAYRGGFTYADSRFKGRVVGPGRVFDVNSLYPAVMYENALPWGTPEYFSGDPSDVNPDTLFITSITFTGKIKPGHIPCIQVKGSNRFIETEYQEVINEPVTLSCTNVDLALWEEHYDLEILSFNGGWKFHSVRGVFRKYIDKWMQVKENSKGGLRAIAKLHLNSLYGKFATNPDVTPKIPVMGDDNRVHLVTGETEERNPVYTAMGVFITAYARNLTIRAAQEHYDDFLYADTDSLHLLGTGIPDTLNVHPSQLGAWKHEYDFQQGIFTRAKCYTERVILPRRQVTRRHVEWGSIEPQTRWETHIAGLPTQLADVVRFTHHLNGAKIDGKLVPKIVPGGVVLTSTSFLLKP